MSSWNLGLLGASTPSVGTFELIESALLTSNTGSITFSNINSTYGTTYQHLQIRAVIVPIHASNGFQQGAIRFNNNSIDNYRGHSLEGNGSSVSSNHLGLDSNLNFVYSSIVWGQPRLITLIMDILDPFETTKHKSVRSLVSHYLTGNPYMGLRSSIFTQTSAIDTITFFTISGDGYNTGSRISLYGIRGA